MDRIHDMEFSWTTTGQSVGKLKMRDEFNSQWAQHAIPEWRNNSLFRILLPFFSSSIDIIMGRTVEHYFFYCYCVQWLRDPKTNWFSLIIFDFRAPITNRSEERKQRGEREREQVPFVCRLRQLKHDSVHGDNNPWHSIWFIFVDWRPNRIEWKEEKKKKQCIAASLNLSWNDASSSEKYIEMLFAHRNGARDRHRVESTSTQMP